MTDKSASTPGNTVDASEEELAGIVRRFIVAYCKWNDAAFASNSTKDAGATYDQLLEEFCPPEFERQTIEYGSESRHDPRKEDVLGVLRTEDRAIVRTKMNRRIGRADLSNEYEYRLCWIGGRWYHVSVKVVINGERFEVL